MEKKSDVTFTEIFAELKNTGILMVTDKLLPSVVAMIVGEPIRGSWWGHPKSHDIFNINVRLAEHPDVIAIKLVSGKNTFVHRKLWSAVIAIGNSNEDWQLNKLKPLAISLLETVKKPGQVQTDSFGQFPGGDSKAITKVAAELENRLLIHAEEIHTDRGSHSRRLETWDNLAKRLDFSPKSMPVAEAKQSFEKILNDLNARYNGHGELPWPKSSEYKL